jgi:hypothetical protein
MSVWTKQEIAKLQRALTEMTRLRKKAIDGKLSWGTVKRVYNHGNCPLCCTVDGCYACPWIIFTKHMCSYHVYHNHADSLIRYADWKKRLSAIQRGLEA